MNESTKSGMQKLREYVDNYFKPFQIALFDEDDDQFLNQLNNITQQNPQVASQPRNSVQSSNNVSHCTNNSNISVNSDYSFEEESDENNNSNTLVKPSIPAIPKPKQNLLKQQYSQDVISISSDMSEDRQQTNRAENTTHTDNQFTDNQFNNEPSNYSQQPDLSDGQLASEKPKVLKFSNSNAPIPIFDRKPLKCIMFSRNDIVSRFKISVTDCEAQPTKYLFQNKHEYAEQQVNYELLQQIQNEQYLSPRTNNMTIVPEISLLKQSLIREALAKTCIKELRPHQLIAINNILDCKNQILSISTAGGKSLIYTLPAIIKNKIIIVITPTIALRNDQVLQLDKMNIKAYQLATQGEYSIDHNHLQTLDEGSLVFITPEKLAKNDVLESLKQLIQRRMLCLFAVDECHLMMDWQGFRKDYAIIPRTISKLQEVEKDSKFSIPVVALTATISNQGVQELQQMFLDQGIRMDVHLFDVYRGNLKIQIVSAIGNKEQKEKQLIEILKQNQQVQQPQTIGPITLRPKPIPIKTIVYCRSKKSNEELAKQIQSQQIACGCFHADIKNPEKVISDFVCSRTQVITATIAFGMGVNITDVNRVVCFDLPSNINEYLQKIGRAGRDGQESTGILFFSLFTALTVVELYVKDKVDYQKKKTQIENFIALVQFCSRNVCYWAQLQQYFCGFNLKRCEKCSACTQKTLSIINCTDYIQALQSFLQVNKCTWQSMRVYFKSELQSNYFNLSESEKQYLNTCMRFKLCEDEQFGYYILNELILAGAVEVGGSGELTVRNKVGRETGWIVM